MRFYTGKMFPEKYHGAIFIARHGPWNRTKKYAADVVVAFLDKNGKVTKVEPFLTGLVENNGYLGRPVDVLVLKDGSLLVSDDHNGAVYRVSYGEVTQRSGEAARAADASRLAALLLLASRRPGGRPPRSRSGSAACLACHGPAASRDPRDAVARRPADVLPRRPALPVPRGPAQHR